MLLVEYDIVYMTRKVVKDSTIAYHLVDNVIEDYKPLDFDLLDEDILVVQDDGRIDDRWTMCFDGFVNVSGNKVGTIIIFLERK